MVVTKILMVTQIIQTRKAYLSNGAMTAKIRCSRLLSISCFVILLVHLFLRRRGFIRMIISDGTSKGVANFLRGDFNVVQFNKLWQCAKDDFSITKRRFIVLIKIAFLTIVWPPGFHNLFQFVAFLVCLIVLVLLIDGHIHSNNFLEPRREHFSCYLSRILTVVPPIQRRDFLPAKDISVSASSENKSSRK